MALRLFDRITTLVKADAHGVVESLEDRTLLLKQCLREAELELNRNRARLETLREEEKRLRRTLSRVEEEARSLDEDVELALEGGKEDLARFAIRRLLPRRDEIASLGKQIAQRAAECGALAQRAEDQQQKLDTLRTRVRAEIAHGRPSQSPAPWAPEPAVAEEEVELELLRRREAGRHGGGAE